MNAQPQEKTYMTPEAYLALERASLDIKHEYVDGEIFAMTGAKKNHILINANMTRELGNRFKTDKSTCKVLPSDMRVKIESNGGYVYPDIAVACGDLEFEDNQLDTLINPIVIIEIFSDSTELYDRTDKVACYRAIPTLQDYILVSQKQYHVEQFTRKEGRTWKMVYYDDIRQSIQIESIGCEVSLSEIYWDIKFEDGTESSR
ncbi:MAG: Uma2 family endonuclease [Thermodesulfobacteriota bacterium]|nr:Uma2 family endonuclease [Thermodesulfobacteriota bacterium]